MDYLKRKILREQLDRTMVPLRSLVESGMPDIGWIKSIRISLGMTVLDLALRVGIDQSRISRLENAEKEGNVKLSSMQKIARALDMEFVYGFVPKTSLEATLYEQGVKYVINKVENTPENLKVETRRSSKQERDNALKDMIQKILIEKPKRFWREK
jgi:predicted DNA-binding mobile mystery protein A